MPGCSVCVDENSGDLLVTHRAGCFVPSDDIAIAHRVLNRIRHHAGGNPEDAADLEATMESLSAQLVSDEVRRQLADADDGHLTLAIAPSLSDVPWELLRIGDEYLCQRFAVGRVLSAGLDKKTSTDEGSVRLSIVANPDFSLPGSVREADRIRELFRRHQRIAVDARSHSVTRDHLRSLLKESDWLHFAGHATRSETGQLGWQLSDGHFGTTEITTASLSRWPRFVFAHACESAGQDSSNDGLSGMAQALLSAGVCHFLGTTVPVLDEPCREFAKAFYESILRHESIGIAVRTARRALRDSHDNLMWATYVLYGDPTTVLLPESERVPDHMDVQFPIPCAVCGRPIQLRHGVAPSTPAQTASEPVCRRCARKANEDGIRPPPRRRLNDPFLSQSPVHGPNQYTSPRSRSMATTGSTCPSCGAAVVAGASFCVECGKAVSGPGQCPKCNADLPQGAKFCVACGTSVLPGVNPIQRIERAVGRGTVSAAGDLDDGNRWRRRTGDFARRFETGDLSALLAKGIVVEEGTRGLLFQDGQFMGDLEPGHYTVQSFTERLKNLVVKRPCTVVLVDIGDVPVNVQFDGLRTGDDQQVGAELQFVIGLRDATDLYVNLMHGETRISADDLATRLQSQLLRPMRAAVADCSVEELYGNRELTDRIEDELRDELQRSFDRFGLRFERVDFVDFKGDPYEQVRELRGGLRRDTALADVNEQRAKLKERFRQVFNEDAMNKVRSKQDFEEFLAQVEQEAGLRGLLRQQEREELWRQYEERKEDHALAREHLLATLDWQHKRERLSRELDYKRDLVQGRQELDDAQRDQRIKALEQEHGAELARLEQAHASELRRLESQRAADLGHRAAEADEDHRQLEREADLGMRLQREWNETKHAAGQQEIERELSHERGKQEIADATAQAAHQRELEKWQALGTMSSEALIAAAPADQAKLLAELKQTEALKGMTEEQILASAAKDSPEVAKAFAEKFRAAGSQQTEMYERLLKEQKEAGNQLADTQRENAKLLREMMETALQTQRDTAVAATQGTHGQPAIVYPPPGSGAAMVVGSQTPQQPSGQSTLDCPQCRSQSPAGSQFCGNCGYRF